MNAGVILVCVAAFAAQPCWAQPSDSPARLVHHWALASDPDDPDAGLDIRPCTTIDEAYGDRGVHSANTWPGGIVPYNFEADVTATDQQRTLDALAEIAAVANITFVPRTTETAYITFRNSTGNSSSVGRTGGQQFINMFNWNVRFIIVHEMMHALGMWHEQSRSDREQYIEINYAKIEAGREGNFNIRATGTLNGPYDFDSVMHYGPTGFSTTGDRTIRVRPAYAQAWQYAIGQRTRMSNGDKWVLATLYGGNPPARNFALSLPAPGQVVGTAWAPAFTWTASQGATSYRLRVDDDPNFASPEIDASVATNAYAQPTPLASGRVFYWTVQSSNTRGTGDPFPLRSRAFFTGAAIPSVLYVDDSAPAGGTGASWASPFRDLQDAMLLASVAAPNASPVSEIRVAQGTYRPSRGATSRASTFRLVNGVALRGGYAGFGSPQPDERNVATYLTTLSGDLSANDTPNFGNRGDNAYNVVTGSFTDATAVIEGFTIRAGNADSGTFPTSRGGGISIDTGSPTIRDCIITDNTTATAFGGLSHNYGGSPRVERCAFVGNRTTGSTSSGQGGAAGARFGANPFFQACRFQGNSARLGGAAYAFDAAPTFVNSVFRANSATGGGAAVQNESLADVVNSTFVANTGAAAITTIDGATTTIANSILWGHALAPISLVGTGTANASYSLVQGGYAGAGNIASDPRFVDQGMGDYRLAPNSPAIDAGRNASVPPGITLDFGGLLRFVDRPSTPDTGSGTAPLVDIGAHELGVACVADVDDGTGTGTPDGGVTVDDLLYYLSVFEDGGVEADLDDGTGTGTPDGGVTIDDLLFFLLRFESGC